MSNLPKLPLYRGYEELLKEPKDMTPEERQRLARIKGIPEEVRAAVEHEIVHLREYIMQTEGRIDRLIDYLNGEPARREEPK